MKLLKKITVTSLLFTLLVSKIDFNAVNVFANNEDNSVKIESILEENKPVNINKVNLDSSGKPISTESVNLNKRSISLSDGYYTLDYGDGWVLGRDAGVIGTMIVPAGVEAVFQKRGTQSFISNISINATASFTKNFVTTTISAQYGHSWVTGNPYELFKIITAPKDKNLYVKVEYVYRKVDVIRVKNGEIVDRAETFKPSTARFKKLEYTTGERVDQSRLYQRTTECILGSSSEDISSVIDQNAHYEGYAHIKDGEDYWSTKYYAAHDTVGIYFTVPKSGRYEFKEILFPKTVGVLNNYIFAGAQKTLYKVNDSNNSKISVIASIPANMRAFDKSKIHYPGDSALTAYLNAGEKYLIVFNSDHYEPDILKMYGKYRYRMRVKCIG